jgi:cytochrome P450
LLPASTLTWGLLYMAREPDVQRRVQAEIDHVVGAPSCIGGRRLPRLQDRESMPYTEAVIMEIQRCANVVPHSLHHMSSR